MAAIYDLPDGFTAPRWDFSKPVQVYLDAETKFIEELSQWCLKRAEGQPKQQFIGEVIDFPVADGKACYMVAAYTPLQLIHLPIGDKWSFQYASRLTKKDVVEKIGQQKALKELFGRTKK